MLNLVLTAVLVAPAAQTGTPPPDPKLVERSVDDVEAALRSKSVEEKVRAITEAGRVPDAAVVAAIRKGMRHEEPQVKQAVVQALRWMEHEDAVETLHELLKRDRSVKREAELKAAVVKAIGQHGERGSIRLLASVSIATDQYTVERARLLALGRIRHVEAVDALLSLMRASDRRRVDQAMAEYRLSLLVLTGTDQGPRPEAWQRWWNDVKKTLQVAPELPRLPRADLIRWTEYWGIERDVGRTQRREDRGRDPEHRRSP